MREDGYSCRGRVIHTLSRKENRRWKWPMNFMDVVKEKAARRRTIHRWIRSSMR
jgi:hypothetical protein